MNKTRWSDQEKEYLLQLIKEHPGQTNIQYAGMLIDKFNRQFSEDSVRKQRKKNKKQPTNHSAVDLVINPDGSHTSTKPLEMSEAQMKDSDFLLNAHGYDPNKWIVVSAKSSVWNQHNKQDGTLTLYASKITVKPKVNGFDFDKLVEVIRKETQPVVFKPPLEEGERLLEVPIFDPHFGISDYEYYKPTQQRILHNIKSKVWEEILFVVGQDMLHNDNFKGQTANGTQIEQVDMVKSWEDCKLFYYPMIDEALKHSKSVKVIYSKGNHDQTISWSFVQMMKERYPQVKFDDGFVERKIHTFKDNVFIGITHGDKARKNLHNIFPVEFPHEWSRAKVRELHTGHLHTQEDKDMFGMMVRTLSTGNKTDQWHKDEGYIGNHKRFMLFEYSEEALESIHYV
jgi:hypothetical protein